MLNPPLRLLLLFQGKWEDECVRVLRRSRDVVLEREGFESFGFPHVFRLLGFDARRYLKRLAAIYRGRIDAVWSNDDQFAALLGSRLAQELGLPGTDPRAIVTAQHKLLMRRALAAALPGQHVAAKALPWPLADPRCRDAAAIARAVEQLDLRWPLFSKPVKGTFSALARQVNDARELARHLSLPWTDRHLLTACARPFAQLAADVMPLPCGPDHVLLEEPQAGQQVNVDGYAYRGDVRVLGVIDECMYEGEVAGVRHFAGFTLPSRLPAAVQQGAAHVAAAAVRAVGFDHGLFNVELFVRGDGSVHVIEINPRAAGQFATLYRAVAGVDVQRLAIHLAAGLPPDTVPAVAATAGAAASLVFRRFDGSPGPVPDDEARAWLAAAHPAARLWLEPPRALRREYRWHGSHRHAVLNLAAKDFATLLRDGEECARRLFGMPSPLAGPP